MLDITNSNKHNFYFMAKQIEDLKPEQLEVSKKLADLRHEMNKLYAAAEKSKDITSLADFKIQIKQLEQEFDKWMFNYEQ